MQQQLPHLCGEGQLLKSVFLLHVHKPLLVELKAQLLPLIQALTLRSQVCLARLGALMLYPCAVLPYDRRTQQPKSKAS